MTNKEARDYLIGVRDACAPKSKTVDALDIAIAAMKDLEVCRNELCLYCGQYKQRHLGACDGCRWYEAPDDYNQSQIQCHGC